jgi:hypothetical protein
MFNLENAVDVWSKEFAGNACGRNDRVEELKDHLFCEIEENIKQGLTEESAFLAATRRFGISKDIKSEFGKGKGIAALLCEADREATGGFTTKQIAIGTGIYLAVFACITFGYVYLTKGKEGFEYFSAILYVLAFLPIVFVSSFQRKGRAECAFMKRMWRKVF